MTPADNATREIIQLAKTTLTRPELDVWLLKNLSGYGRRAGSIRLGITEDAWRYRLTQAERKLLAALIAIDRHVIPDQEKPAA